MSKLLSVVMAAGLLVYPFATFAADYGSQPSQDQQVPPVAQTLVREGDFAVKLAQKLGLGSPSEEAAAEEVLAKAGIAPVNGWISDYPVTPEIIGQLSDSIRKASSDGKLPQSADTARQELVALADEMKIAVPAGETTTGQPPSEDNTVINNYYSDVGPPVVTYYEPPGGFAYLYDWVPFPAVWFGFRFPGFFILHDFTLRVRTFGVHHHFRNAIVSNHFFDPRSRRFHHVHHAFRSFHGRIRPETRLFAERRGMFADRGRFGHSVPDRFGPFSTRPLRGMGRSGKAAGGSIGSVPRVPSRPKVFNPPATHGSMRFGPPMAPRNNNSVRTFHSAPRSSTLSSPHARSAPSRGGWHGRSSGGFGGHRGFGGHGGGIGGHRGFGGHGGGRGR